MVDSQLNFQSAVLPETYKAFNIADYHVLRWRKFSPRNLSWQQKSDPTVFVSSWPPLEPESDESDNFD